VGTIPPVSPAPSWRVLVQPFPQIQNKTNGTMSLGWIVELYRAIQSSGTVPTYGDRWGNRLELKM